jgi:type I restriction enzyme M protein
VTEEIDEQSQDGIEETEGESEALIDILSGEAIPASPKNRLVQKVVRQFLESYGFDRVDIKTGYRLTCAGKRQKFVDIAIIRHGQEARDENVERVVVCQPQKVREKLRGADEAAGDLRKLHEKLELFPACHLGMWTNGREEFFVQAEDTKFETRFSNIGAWPAPGERTDQILREGGATQVAADPDDLEAALGRCHQFLYRNLSLGADAFKPLGALLLAKMHDETRPPLERHFWIRGPEPFTADGQAAIRDRVTAAFESARTALPTVLAHGWDLGHLDAAQTARLVTELARYSLTDTLPKSRTTAFRAGARSTMDGRDGRYPTPLNVAQMAVEMLDPGPDDRVFDGSCGMGTFLAMAATHLFEKFISQVGATPYTASPKQLRDAQALTSTWAQEHLFGCDMAPLLVVATRLNVLLAAGHPGNIFRLDARTFPEGELEDIATARAVMPDGSMDIVLTNPWFSTKETIKEEGILRRYALGKVWTKTDEGHFVDSGALNTAGVPPEVLFLERAWRWAKPGTGRIGILLPDGLLGNPGDEYVRWWILRHCEVLASIDLPVEPFKVTLKDYRVTPALPSFLVLRRRSQEELNYPTHPEYWVFMAVVNRAGFDARGNLLFERAPDGEELIFDGQVVERVRIGGQVTSRTISRRQRHIDERTPCCRQTLPRIHRQRQERTLKEKIVPSAWLEQEGRRLDCGLHLSGGMEAKILLADLQSKKEPLQSLTRGGIEGIFHAGREGRRYVLDETHGTPFLGSTDILAADLSFVPLISKVQVAATPKFAIQKNWILITRSGTVGRMGIARPDMHGMSCSEHVLRVVPDEKKVYPGYLFAYLSCRFGVPLVVGARTARSSSISSHPTSPISPSHDLVIASRRKLQGRSPKRRSCEASLKLRFALPRGSCSSRLD